MDFVKVFNGVLDTVATAAVFFGALVVGLLHMIFIVIIMIARGAWRF